MAPTKTHDVHSPFRHSLVLLVAMLSTLAFNTYYTVNGEVLLKALAELWLLEWGS